MVELRVFPAAAAPDRPPLSQRALKASRPVSSFWWYKSQSDAVADERLRRACAKSKMTLGPVFLVWSTYRASAQFSPKQDGFPTIESDELAALTYLTADQLDAILRAMRDVGLIGESGRDNLFIRRIDAQVPAVDESAGQQTRRRGDGEAWWWVKTPKKMLHDARLLKVAAELDIHLGDAFLLWTFVHTDAQSPGQNGAFSISEKLVARLSGLSLKKVRDALCLFDQFGLTDAGRDLEFVGECSAAPRMRRKRARDKTAESAKAAATAAGANVVPLPRSAEAELRLGSREASHPASHPASQGGPRGIEEAPPCQVEQDGKSLASDERFPPTPESIIDRVAFAVGGSLFAPDAAEAAGWRAERPEARRAPAAGAPPKGARAGARDPLPASAKIDRGRLSQQWVSKIKASVAAKREELGWNHEMRGFGLLLEELRENPLLELSDILKCMDQAQAKGFLPRDWFKFKNVGWLRVSEKKETIKSIQFIVNRKYWDEAVGLFGRELARILLDAALSKNGPREDVSKLFRQEWESNASLRLEFVEGTALAASTPEVVHA
jgi:hypothetical protein